MDQGVITYREMLVAIMMQMIVYAVIGSALLGEWITFSTSVMIGGAIAIGILGSMKRTIEVALLLDPDSAKKYGRRQSLVRIAFMGLMLCMAFYFRRYVNPWGVLAGVFALKISAYLQPGIHKFYEKIMKRRIRGK